MNVIRRRGWEIPERFATPEHIFFNRRDFLAGAGVGALALSPQLAAAQRIADLPDPSSGLYPAKQNEKFTLDRAVTEEKINLNYNNFYEFSPNKSLAQAGTGAQAAPVDGQDRRHGREAAGDRHRRSPQADAARGAALPPSLRRSLVDGDSVVGISAGQAGRAGKAAVLGDLSANGDLLRQGDGARAAQVVPTRGLISKG